MFTRTVTLDLDPDMWDEAVAFGAEIRERLSGFEGLRDWYLAADRMSGKAVSFSVFDDEASFQAVNDQINAIVAEFARFFVSPPEERLGEVIVTLRD